jgi:hypothetical protein
MLAVEKVLPYTSEEWTRPAQVRDTGDKLFGNNQLRTGLAPCERGRLREDAQFGMTWAKQLVDSAEGVLADESRTDRRFVMPKTRSARIQDHFTDLTDPRRRPVTYPPINMVRIAIGAVICGADDFVAIAKFGRAKQKWLSRFLDLSSGSPSHDRFNHVLAAIKPAEFEACC